MFTAELIFAGVEVLLLVYLVRKQKEIAKEKSRVEFTRKSLENYKVILDEYFIPELEARKNKIIDEFKEKLYNYHHVKQS